MYGQPKSHHVRARAIVAAGPIFLTSTTLAGLYLQLPDPVEITAASLLTFLFALIPAVFIGGFLSVLPNLVGAAMMTFAGSRFVAFRSSVAWAVAGAVIGLLVASATEAPPAVAFGLIATSALCGRICWRRDLWDDEDLA